MPGRRDDKVADVTVRVLREIRDEVKELRGDVKELRGEVHEGFDLLGRRIDNVLLGEHRHEHEELRGRVERIEQHLGIEPH